MVSRKNRFALLFLLLLVCIPSLAAEKKAPSSISATKQDVREIRASLDSNANSLGVLKERVDNLVELQERTSNDLSKEIDLSNRIISICSIVIAIIAVILGFYVAWMERKMKRLKGVVEKKEEEVRALVNMVNNDIGGLCDRIRREDIVALLNRLEQVPRDILNIGGRLLYIELEECDFPKIKNAYLKLKEEGAEDETSADSSASCGDCYSVVLFQHFLGKTIEDEQLRSKIKIKEFFRLGMSASFPNDIEKSTRDLAVMLAKKTRLFDRAEILLEYLKALDASPYSGNSSLLELLKIGIKDDTLWGKVEFSLQEGSKPVPKESSGDNHN